MSVRALIVYQSVRFKYLGLLINSIVSNLVAGMGIMAEVVTNVNLID